MIVPSLHVPDARAVLRYTDSVSKTDVYVAGPEKPNTRTKIAMLHDIAVKMGLTIAIQNFPDLSKEPE